VTQNKRFGRSLGLRRREALTDSSVAGIREALLHASYSYVAGTTHGFYHYPARFSATIASTIIERFTDPGDWVLDPFMGGGTSIIEGLALGRRMLGVDINTLACFVSRVRTTPLSKVQSNRVLQWASRLAQTRIDPSAFPPRAVAKNLPPTATGFLAGALQAVHSLETRPERAFARCVLLRLGQLALDCRKRAPSRSLLNAKVVSLAAAMLEGMDEYILQCRRAGLSKRDLLDNRRLVCRSAIGLETDARLSAAAKRPRLVITSPPYPGVHVVYHRWQYRGRRETSAPYWIASQRDGKFESFYTGGSRTPTGEQRYFAMIEGAFRSVRHVIHPASHVVQLVGFADAARQLPHYLEAMRAAGYSEWTPPGLATRLGRRVPNRKWYASMQGHTDAASELLLIHRPT
jgi:hypothetical protein